MNISPDHHHNRRYWPPILVLIAALLCLAATLRADAAGSPQITVTDISAAPNYSQYKSPIAQICAKVSPVTDTSGSFSAEVYINGAKANSLDCAWLDNLNTYDSDSSAATVYLRVPVDQGLHDYLRGASASLSKDYTFSVRLQYYDQDENSSPVQKECLSNPYTIDKYTAPAAPKPVIKKIAKYSSSSTTLAYVYVDNCTAGTVYMDDVKRSTCTYVSSKKAFKVNVPAELGKYLAGKTKVLPNAHVFRVVSSKGVKSANKTVAATVAKPVISKVTKYSSASNTYAYVYCSNCTKEAKVYLNGTKKTAAYEAGKKRFKVAVPAALGQYLNGSSQFLAKDYSFKVINKAGSVSAVKTIAAKPDIPAISNIGKYQNTYAYVYVSNFSKTYGFKCEIDSGSGWKSATSSYVSSKSALKVKVDSAVGKYLKGTNKYIDKDYKFRVTCNDKNKKGKVSAVYTIKRNSAPPSITAVKGKVIEEYAAQGNADLGYRITSAATVTVKSSYTNYTVWLNGVQLSKAASVGSNAYHVPYELARYLEGSSSQLSQDYKFVAKNPDGKSSAAKVIKASYPSGTPQIAQVSTEGDCWIKLYVTDCPSGKILIDGLEAVSFSIPAEGDEEGGYFIYVYDESEITWVANGWRGKLSKSHTVQVARGDKQKTFLNLNAGMTRSDFVDTDLTAISAPTPRPSGSPTPTPTPSASPNVFAGGNGTAENPFIIKTAAQLDKVRDYSPINNYYGCCFKLANDIDLTNYNFTPIETFSGNFDGNNHTITLDYHISEWDINQNYYVGLFGRVFNTSDSIIKNLTVDGIVEVHDIDKKSLYCGAIAGNYYGGDNEIYLINCHNKATIKYTSTGIQNADIGGLMGWGWYVNMVNCTNEGNIEVQCDSADTEVGGLCGYPNNLKMYNCKNKADLTYSGGGDVYIAGLTAGHAFLGYTEVSDNCNSGNITIETANDAIICGLYNRLNGAAITNCFNTGFINCLDCQSCGIYGVINEAYEPANISGCYNTGTITASASGSRSGYDTICGVIGSARDSSISDCYNVGNITATSKVGHYGYSIHGVIDSYECDIITNCNNQGNITVTAEDAESINYITGVGSSDSLINCYNLGNITLATNRGDIIGVGSGHTITNCYNQGKLTITGDFLSSSSISSRHHLSGIAGECENISYCYNSGDLEASVNGSQPETSAPSVSIAGILLNNTTVYNGYSGGRYDVNITNCYNTGNILSQRSNGINISGIVCSTGSTSQSQQTVERCFNSGNIIVQNTNHAKGDSEHELNRIAGITGNASKGTTISNCYNTGNISGEYSNCAGIVGYVSVNSFVSNCYNTGSIIGDNCNCAGIAGDTWDICLETPRIANCYNAGTISGENSTCYGLLGHLTNQNLLDKSSGRYVSEGKFIRDSYFMQTDDINHGISACEAIAIDENVSALSEAQFRGLLSVGAGDKMLYELLGDLFCRNTAQDNVLGSGILNGFPILRWQTEEQ